MPFSTKIINFLSAEWILKNRSNGGSAILLRALFSSIVLFFFTLLIVNWIDPMKSFSFSLFELQKEIVENVSWFGIFFVTIYTALYVRFSSQWTYLANLYNFIKSCSVNSGASEEVLAEWKAAFIEDAEYLHLACKDNYASIIHHWGSDSKVKEKYIKFTPGGEKRLNNILADVEKVYERTNKKYNTP